MSDLDAFERQHTCTTPADEMIAQNVAEIVSRHVRELRATRSSGIVTVKVENGNIEEIRRSRQLMECVIQVRGRLREYRSIPDEVAVPRQVRLGSVSRLSIIC
jgi:hypothetical protein